MKKCDFGYAAYFLIGVILLVIMPLGFFLSVEILMWMLGYTETKVFLKDHGSSIVGLAAIAVAAITILFHGKYAREQIAESRRLSSENRFFEKRELVLMRLASVRGKLDKFRDATYVTKSKEYRGALAIEIRDDLLEISTIASSYEIPCSKELYGLAEIGNILYYSLLYYERTQNKEEAGGVFIGYSEIVEIIIAVMDASDMPEEITNDIFIPLLKNLTVGNECEDSHIASWLVFNMYNAVCDVRGKAFFMISSQSVYQEILPKFRIREDELKSEIRDGSY